MVKGEIWRCDSGHSCFGRQWHLHADRVRLSNSKEQLEHNGEQPLVAELRHEIRGAEMQRSNRASTSREGADLH
jgi:hypothetical protein